MTTSAAAPPPTTGASDGPRALIEIQLAEELANDDVLLTCVLVLLRLGNRPLSVEQLVFAASELGLMKIEFREMTVYSKLNIYLRSCKLLRKDPIFRRVVVNKTRNHYYLSNINLPATVDWISPPPPSILTYAERDALRTSTKANSAATAVSKKKPTLSADIQSLNKADKKRLIFGLPSSSGSTSTTQASIPDSRWTTSRKSRGAATDDDEMDWKDASSTSKSRTPRHSKKRHRTSFGPCNPDGLRPELKCIPPYQDLLLSDKLPFVPSAASPTTNALLLPPQTYYFVQNERCMNKPKFGGEIRCRSCIWKHRERLPYCFFVGFRAFRVRFDDELNGGGDVQKTEETTSMDVDVDGVVKSDRTIGGNPVTFDPADKYRIISDVPAENLVYGPFFIPDGRDVGVPVAVTVKQVCAVTAGTTRAELLEKCGLTEDGFVVTEDRQEVPAVGNLVQPISEVRTASKAEEDDAIAEVASAMMHINQVDDVPQNPESVIVDIVQPNVAQHAETIVNDVKESNFARQIEPVAVDVDEPASAQCDETILVEVPIPEATMVDIEEPTLKQTKTVVEEPMPEPIVVHTETSTLGQQIPKNQDLVAAIIDKPGVQHEATAPLAPIAVNSTTNKVETVSPTKSSPITKNPATSPKKRRSSVSRRQIDVKDFPDLLKTTTPFPFVPSPEDSNNNELLVPSGAHYHVQQDKCLREKYADFPKCRSCRWKQKDRLPNCFYIGFRAFLVNDWESLVQAAKVADEDGSVDVLGDDGLRLVCDIPAENMVYGPYFIPGGVDVTSSAVSPVKRTKRKRRGSRRSLSASDADGEEGDNEEFGGEANKKVALLEEVQEEEKTVEVEPSREMSIESPEEVETEPEVAVEDALPVVDQIEEPEGAEDFIIESRPESTLVSTPVISSHPVNSPLDLKPSLVIQPPLSQLQSQSNGLSQQHQPATVVYSHLPPISHHPSFAQQMQQQQPVPIMYPQPILTPIIYSHSVVPPPTVVYSHQPVQPIYSLPPPTVVYSHPPAAQAPQPTPITFSATYTPQPQQQQQQQQQQHHQQLPLSSALPAYYSMTANNKTHEPEPEQIDGVSQLLAAVACMDSEDAVRGSGGGGGDIRRDQDDSFLHRTKRIGGITKGVSSPAKIMKGGVVGIDEEQAGLKGRKGVVVGAGGVSVVDSEEDESGRAV